MTGDRDHVEPRHEPLSAAGAPDGTNPTRGLRLSGVTKTYGTGEATVHALRDVDLRIEPGELTVFFGPSGSGKTTLLNVIGGIEPATGGQVIVDGRDVADLDEKGRTSYRRDTLGFVFQFFNLVPSLTAIENVLLVAELTGRGDRETSMAALDAVGLSDRADHFPSQMSGGQQQRVAIARAIVKRPSLLLCDEPTGALDLDTGRCVLTLLQELNREGRTLLVVTHNSAIRLLAHRVVRMGSGRVLEVTRTTPTVRVVGSSSPVHPSG